MAMLHFLNVKEGDCAIIQHNTEHVTVVDVSNASPITEVTTALESAYKSLAATEAVAAPKGNFGQKKYPVNPIQYMVDFGITYIFRFILTHPDMDHMDGIKALFAQFSPINFWDTENTCEKEDFSTGKYDKADWEFYKSLRDGNGENPKRLVKYSGDRGKYWNEKEDGTSGGDGLHILAPTPELLAAANESEDFNDCSYVFLYRTGNSRRILIAGDSHDNTWEHILETHSEAVCNVDLLLAPHHGRKSDRDYKFLDTVNPKMTYFGNARNEYLAYDAWNNRSLPFITNNQANCIVVEIDSNSMSQYVTNKSYAETVLSSTFYSERHKAWYIGDI